MECIMIHNHVQGNYSTKKGTFLFYSVIIIII